MSLIIASLVMYWKKVVPFHVSSYLNSHNLCKTFQSAHSTETALLKIVNDLLLPPKHGEMSEQTLLVFSTAFHSIHVHRLQTNIEVTNAVRQWFSSYLTDRTLNVSLLIHCSTLDPVHSRVSRSSVLGTILFTIYIMPLSSIIDSHCLTYHSFADNIQ